MNDRNKEINEYLNSLSVDELNKRNEEQCLEDAKDFEELKTALAQGKCNYCGYPITHFS